MVFFFGSLLLIIVSRGRSNKLSWASLRLGYSLDLTSQLHRKQKPKKIVKLLKVNQVVVVSQAV